MTRVGAVVESVIVVTAGSGPQAPTPSAPATTAAETITRGIGHAVWGVATGKAGPRTWTGGYVRLTKPVRDGKVSATE